MTSNTDFLLNSCIQRKRQQLLNRPTARLELQLSPYNNYSQTQLDMRRKAEILLYSANKSNTKTNKFTKAENWKQLVNGSFKRRSNINNTMSQCSFKENILTPTSSCDVPGPIMLLINDPTVPLYNYSTNIDSYSKLPPQPIQDDYTVYTNDNVYIPANIYKVISTIYMHKNNTNTFNINIPVGINMSVFSRNNIVNSNNNVIIDNSIEDTINIIIESVNIGLFYNDYIILDMQNKTQLNIDTNINLNVNNINLNKPEFNMTFFIGNININNVKLNTSNGNIYDIKCLFKYRISSVHKIINNSSIICNLTKQNIMLVSNATINYNTNKIYSPFSIT
jgi:hypothetical protein